MDVVLGFLEEPINKDELTSNYFPNKIGGKPAWLDLGNIPKREELLCEKCSKQMSFLLQIYAPWDEKKECHHRSVFIFCCQNGGCNYYKAIRSQLEQVNEYYPEDAEERKYEEGYSISEEKYLVNRQTTCEFCGLHSKSKCAGCQKVNYCCKEHQQADWDLGHREQCKILKEKPDTPSDKLPSKKQVDFLFKEFELINETMELLDFPMYHNYGSSSGASGADQDDEDDEEEHEDDDADDVEIDEHGNVVKMSQCKDLMITKEITTNDPDTIKDFEDYVGETGKSGGFNDETFLNIKDKQLLYFRRILAKDQDQVLRYCRDPNYPIVWVSETDKQNPQEVPCCENCGGNRKFEFQILPPLLYFLGMDQQLMSTIDIDFGVLSIYTCENSCKKNSTYKNSLINEFIFKQDFKK
ncbi:hypothetical protein DICPUDRAFT_87536 [Dictyostelium purpureum]|uniref:MYND-type domain-containing protein n=1 Tax=Dictyostelium purpureum TaxID=5786 RepID=F0ZIS9_DICPU|nr:uncharacterized protein DICPUDRAFT_87536 [Dictyostelium purpureum]EGC36129.1 hypothetical protein DICPUDRAFT_87536 [Dictyostelium purpureum]|eukprot:XP_003287322.1 hypothetical protein DICPUDRAFT_87536 [Dictyostelium purpureum]